MSENRREPAGLPSGLAALMARAGEAVRERPVERWNPPYCGEIDMEVAGDGTWFYGGSPIGREALVRLFASILRREEDGGHVLVTPVEKVGIRVADAPFLAVEMEARGTGEARTLVFRTNVGDVIEAGPEHPLRFVLANPNDGLKPYLAVRGRLEALLTRPLLHELVGLAEEQGGRLGVRSGGAFFAFPQGTP